MLAETPNSPERLAWYPTGASFGQRVKVCEACYQTKNCEFDTQLIMRPRKELEAEYDKLRMQDVRRQHMAHRRAIAKCRKLVSVAGGRPEDVPDGLSPYVQSNLPAAEQRRDEGEDEDEDEDEDRPTLNAEMQQDYGPHTFRLDTNDGTPDAGFDDRIPPPGLRLGTACPQDSDSDDQRVMKRAMQAEEHKTAALRAQLAAALAKAAAKAAANASGRGTDPTPKAKAKAKAAANACEATQDSDSDDQDSDSEHRIQEAEHRIQEAERKNAALSTQVAAAKAAPSGARGPGAPVPSPASLAPAGSNMPLVETGRASTPGTYTTTSSGQLLYSQSRTDGQTRQIAGPPTAFRDPAVMAGLSGIMDHWARLGSRP
jgi:hypothetical protein